MVLGKIKYVKKSDSEKYCEGKMKRNSGSCGEKEQEIFILKESKNKYFVIVCLLYEESATYLLMRAYKAK